MIMINDNDNDNKLPKAVVHKDIENVTPVLNYLLFEGSITPSEYDLFSDALAKKKIRGESVTFLPSDIDGIWQKFNLLEG